MINSYLVSIIIPTFNRENYLPQTIESVLNQTYKNFELIIVDDGSTDNTGNIVKKYLSDNRIKYIYQENMNVCSARNTGIINSHGDYIMFLDDDDQYLPDAVEKLLSNIKKQPENVKLVYGEIIYFNEKEKSFPETDKLLAKPELYLQFLIGCNIITPGQVIIEAQTIKNLGMFDNNFQHTSDYELWTRLIIYYDIAKISVPVIYYRIHENQYSNNMGIIRYYSDKTALKFWNLLKEKNIPIFNDNEEKEKIAEQLEWLANKTINYFFAHYDTALELLKYAQEIFYNKKRETLISYLTENIPKLLKEHFNSDLRLSEQDKVFKNNGSKI